MHIEITDKFLDELKHTADQLGKRTMSEADNDIRSAYLLLESIADSAEKGVEAHPRLINREGHTHVLLTSFCLNNEWLGEKERMKNCERQSEKLCIKQARHS